MPLWLLQSHSNMFDKLHTLEIYPAGHQLPRLRLTVLSTPSKVWTMLTRIFILITMFLLYCASGTRFRESLREICCRDHRRHRPLLSSQASEFPMDNVEEPSTGKNSAPWEKLESNSLSQFALHLKKYHLAFVVSRNPYDTVIKLLYVFFNSIS